MLTAWPAAWYYHTEQQTTIWGWSVPQYSLPGSEDAAAVHCDLDPPGALGNGAMAALHGGRTMEALCSVD